MGLCVNSPHFIDRDKLIEIIQDFDVDLLRDIATSVVLRLALNNRKHDIQMLQLFCLAAMNKCKREQMPIDLIAATNSVMELDDKGMMNLVFDLIDDDDDLEVPEPTFISSGD